ncbi:hypothetical protein A8C32_18845 [Flavivirga aquatica]|uniref:Uncharacterized protein n=1 Tax=Flavivirga aquatica TaxID=1849968 RepID=A0A1E5T3Y4_9FLAO|nr:hypothetical protein [Flavivirga aquatica]OEK06090.1 hypothetical protein A8C32_18845 [Flavivirga aquatica]
MNNIQNVLWGFDGVIFDSLGFIKENHNKYKLHIISWVFDDQAPSFLCKGIDILISSQHLNSKQCL